MATIIREAVYLGKKKVIFVATTSPEVARGIIKLTDDSNVEDVTLSGTSDSNGALNWLEVTVRGDLSAKAQSSIVRVIQDCQDTFMVKEVDSTEEKSGESNTNTSTRGGFKSKTASKGTASKSMAKKSVSSGSSKSSDDGDVKDKGKSDTKNESE